MKSSARALVLSLCAAALVAAAPTAEAQSAEGVTLRASRTTVDYGTKVKLSGKVSPASPDQPVQIVNETGEVVAAAATDESGKYALRHVPRANTTLRAQWMAFLSDPVPIKVRPEVRVHLSGVRLFDRAHVRGRVIPSHEGHRVMLRIYRNGKPIAKRPAKLDGAGSFSTSFGVRKPGSYRIKAAFDDRDHLGARASSRSLNTPLPSLGIGARGYHVKVLEQRLRALGYYLAGIDKRYDYRTGDAVIAFHKVQGLTRSSSLGEGSWRALATPQRPRPRVRRAGFHIEIDQTKQVIYTVSSGKVKDILHTSTGAGGATRDGYWTVHRKLAGYSGGGLYYPSYFDGLRAIHGWEEVPTYPASHGCARVPMWAATWIYGKADIGTRVIIYH